MKKWPLVSLGPPPPPLCTSFLAEGGRAQGRMGGVSAHTWEGGDRAMGEGREGPCQSGPTEQTGKGVFLLSVIRGREGVLLPQELGMQGKKG